MSRSIATLARYCAFTMVLSTFLAASARAETAAQRQAKLDAALEKAMRAVFNGPEIKKLNVNGHEFNVKKAQFIRNGQTTTIKGQLSHHLSLRPDDQIYYTIEKVGNQVVSMNIKIDRGGLAPYVSKFLADVVHVPIPEERMESLIRKLGAKVDGKWETAADLIVAAISVRGNAVGQDQLVLYRAKIASGRTGGTAPSVAPAPFRRTVTPRPAPR